jgi:3-deoxy-manno-octulosonate cytidylyltransferase (CMP-KDO synthetase)
MIEHVYQRAARAPGVDAVVVATDNERIAEAVARFGGAARMTSGAHRTGTDRVAEVAATLASDIVVNVQGDEPLIEPAMIAQVIAPFRDPGVVMTTLRRALADPAEIASPHIVKVVVDQNEDALYFSRSPIPFGRGEAGVPPLASYAHVGLYAYRREFLLTLAALPPTPLEIAESLEQLRALEHGFRIRTPATPYASIGVDTPEDLERVRRQLREQPAGARA